MRYFLAAILLFLIIPNAKAQFTYDRINTTPKANIRASGGLSLSKIDYETDDANFRAERTVIGGEVGKSVFSTGDVFGIFGVILDGELEDDVRVEDGSGFLLGGGVRALVYSIQRIDFSAYGLFSYLTEEYDDKVNVKIDLMELQTGSIASYTINRMFVPYSGIALTLISNGDIDVEGASSVDMERDSMISLIGGATISLDSGYLRPEIILFDEQTFSFSGGFVF